MVGQRGATFCVVVPDFLQHGLCENLVKNSGIPYTILQPTFFADNFVNFSGQTIQQASSIFNASGEGKVPWVATEDISLVAATLLMDPVPHAGKTLVLTGSEAITTAECAAIISKVIGKEVKVWLLRFFARCKHASMLTCLKKRLRLNY